MSKNIFLILFLSTFTLFGQESKEYALGVNVNSRSSFIGGIDFRIKNLDKSKNINRFLLFEIANVKNLNELRVSTGFNSVTNNFGNRAFILGKSNALYALRGQFGFDKTIFKRLDRNGVRLGLDVAGGVALGLVKPYVIVYEYQNPNETKKEAYNSKIHTDYNDILGSAGFFYGWSDVKIVPALNTRIALNAEFGGNSRFSTILEAGFLLEAYSKRIELIEGAKEEWFYQSVFVALYIGKK